METEQIIIIVFLLILVALHYGIFKLGQSQIMVDKSIKRFRKSKDKLTDKKVSQFYNLLDYKKIKTTYLFMIILGTIGIAYIIGIYTSKKLPLACKNAQTEIYDEMKKRNLV